MNIYIKIVFVACISFFFVSDGFSDNESLKKRLLLRAGRQTPIDFPNARVPFDYIVTGGQPTYEQLKRTSEL